VSQGTIRVADLVFSAGKFGVRAAVEVAALEERHQLEVGEPVVYHPIAPNAKLNSYEREKSKGGTTHTL